MELELELREDYFRRWKDWYRLWCKIYKVYIRDYNGGKHDDNIRAEVAWYIISQKQEMDKEYEEFKMLEKEDEKEDEKEEEYRNRLIEYTTSIIK